MWWLLYVPPNGCVVFTIFNALLVWLLYYVPPYECVVLTIFNALLECGGGYIYLLMNVWCLVNLMPY